MAVLPLARLPLLLLALAAPAAAQQKKRPPLGGAASKGSAEENLGSQLLAAVTKNDLAEATAVLAGVTEKQATRLANAVDWRGKSVLMHAASRDHAEIVTLLLGHKARVETVDYSSQTALMLAARNGSTTSARLLCDGGADVHALTTHGTSVLMQACAFGSVESVEYLLARGVDVNVKDKSGASALSIAAAVGTAQLVRLLVGAGANVDSADAAGSTALIAAADGLNLEIVNALLGVGADIDLADNEGMTPLMAAVRYADGHDVVSALLEARDARGLRNDGAIDAFAKSGHNALALAAGSAHSAIVAALLSHGADVNAMHGSDGSSALMAAAESGDTPVVRALLSVGADVNLVRWDNLSSLMAACGQTNEEIIELLLDAGAEPNALDSRGVSACHMAAEVGAVGAVAALVKRGADCTIMSKHAAISPLIVAAAAGELEMVELLLALTPADQIDAVHDDKSAMTAFMAACSNGSLPIVNKLLEVGVEINKRNSDGVTALMHASVLGHTAVVERLLDAGGDMHAHDNDGFDALVAAATGSAADVSKLLLTRGLHIEVMAGSGGNPLMIASKAGSAECVKVYLDAGAEVDARAKPSAAFVSEIEGLVAQDEAEMDEPAIDSKRQRLDAYFEEGSTALMHAAALGHPEVVKLLVLSGADCRLRDRDGQSALVHAANVQSLTAVATLLEVGNADPNDTTAEAVPLLVHALQPPVQEALAESLIKAGADPNAPAPADAAGGAAPSPLQLAAAAGSTKLVQLLLQRGAAVVADAAGGQSPMISLAAAGNVRGVKLILEAAKASTTVGLVQAVLDATGENGTAALHHAAKSAHVKVVTELLSEGASVSLRDLRGATALGYAYDGLQEVAKYVVQALAEYGQHVTSDSKLATEMLGRAGAPHIDAMELLLAAGSEPSLIDHDGNTVDAAAIIASHRSSAGGAEVAELGTGAKEEL